ncbi:hypothetical protein [Streptomyces endophytica]|uniref:Uncharacterized protein n=1 Tax=Streptomyces endophytica TaxID=2991496 RepID=A0ABY6PK06_9ACTN|nr:hypothetical protein [Streptomyces endophytica]UZJ33477.1 hypothetical protein OJ254_28385 [Streptomyces endophytica]
MGDQMLLGGPDGMCGVAGLSQRRELWGESGQQAGGEFFGNNGGDGR